MTDHENANANADSADLIPMDGPDLSAEELQALREHFDLLAWPADDEPVPAMPAHVAEMIDTAIAHEAGVRSGGVIELGSRKRRRSLTVGMPLVAASAVLLGFAVVGNINSSSETDLVASEVASDAAPAAESALRADAPESAPTIVQAGFIPPTKKMRALDLNVPADEIPGTVSQLLLTEGIDEPTDLIDMPAEDFAPMGDGMTSDEQMLRKCITTITKKETSQALLVVRASVDGADVGVVVVPEVMIDMPAMENMTEDEMREVGEAMGETTIYVVKTTCGMPEETNPTLVSFTFSLS